MRYVAASLVALLVSVSAVACDGGLPAVPGDDGGAAPPVVTPVTAPDGGPSPEGGPAPDGGPGPDGAAPEDCTRETRARTAPTSLYDAFVADIAAISAEPARKAKAAAFLADVAAKGGGPLEDPASDRVVFLASGEPPAGPWSVVGSFVGWDKARAQATTRVVGTDLFVLDLRIPRGTAHTYKLLSGTSDTGFREDLTARNVVWDGINKQTVGEMNGIVHADAIPEDKPRMVAFRAVPSPTMGNARDVFVWLPPAYDGATCKKLPIVVFHDGNVSLTRGDFVSPAEALYRQKPELSSILAFVALPNQNVRMSEYTFATGGARGSEFWRRYGAEVERLLVQAGRAEARAEKLRTFGATPHAFDRKRRTVRLDYDFREGGVVDGAAMLAPSNLGSMQYSTSPFITSSFTRFSKVATSSIL